MFDTTLQIIDVQINTNTDAPVGPEGGVLQLALIIGLALPVGPNQVGHIPMGIIRGNLRKEQALQVGKEITEEAENLKSPIDIQIATDLAGVERAATQVNNLTHNPNGPQR